MSARHTPDGELPLMPSGLLGLLEYDRRMATRQLFFGPTFLHAEQGSIDANFFRGTEGHNG